MSYAQAATHQVRVQSVRTRHSKHAVDEILVDPTSTPDDPGPMAAPIAALAQRLHHARDKGASVVLCYGAHLVKNGLGPLVADLVAHGWITHLATNGAGVIHDWEYAFHGHSEEDVRANIPSGTFGAWDETGRYTLMATATGALTDMGYGESIGRLIDDGGCDIPDAARLAPQLAAWATTPDGSERAVAAAELLRCIKAGSWVSGWHEIAHARPEISLTAAAYRLRVPLTVHPGIGYDIVFVHPQASGAALGRAAGIDFRVLCTAVDGLDKDGVVLSVGSAVMAPQVMEKAASVVNNLRRQAGKEAIAPYVAVNDLQVSNWDWSRGEPPPDDPAYYLRFLKSFARLAGPTLSYVALDNRVFLHNLYHQLVQA